VGKKKEVNIHYLRIVTVPENAEFNLQSLATKAHRQLRNLKDRTFDRGERRYSCLHCREDKDGLLLNISVCSPDEPTNIIPKPNAESVVAPSLVVAPKNSDFMDGDVYALLWGNNVLVCSVRSKPTLFKAYLGAIFSDLRIDIPEYLLVPAMPTQALKMLKEGIKRVDLFAAAHAVNLTQINDASQGCFANLILAVLHAEKPLTAALEQKNTHAKVIV